MLQIVLGIVFSVIYFGFIFYWFSRPKHFNWSKLCPNKSNDSKNENTVAYGEKNLLFISAKQMLEDITKNMSDLSEEQYREIEKQTKKVRMNYLKGFIVGMIGASLPIVLFWIYYFMS